MYLALNPIKTIVKQYCPVSISGEAVRIIRNFLEKIAIEISFQAIKEFEKYNKAREIQRLPIKKRLDALAVERAVPIALDNFYKSYSVNHLGLQPLGTGSPGGKKMSVNKEPPKSVSENYRNDGGNDGH